MSSLALTDVGGPNDIPCVPHTNSNYAAAVLADAPAVYWQLQDCSGNPVDTSGAGLDCTANTLSANWYRQIGPLTNAVLDKSIVMAGGGGCTGPLVSVVQNGFTIEFWIKVDEQPNPNQEMVYNGSGSFNGWGVMREPNGKFRYLAGGVAFGAFSTATISVGPWYHVAIVRNTTWTYYLNGAVETANAGNTNPNVPTTTTHFFPSALQRYCAHIAIYETALSAAQIAAHYAAR